MAKKKSVNLCTNLGCKTTSDAMLAIMLGLVLIVIIYFVAINGADHVSDTFNSIVPTVYGIIAIATLAIILVEKLQKKITMAETGKKVVMAVVYLVLFSAALAIAKVIANMFGLN